MIHRREIQKVSNGVPRCAVGSIVKKIKKETPRWEKNGRGSGGGGREDVRRDWGDLENHRMVIKSRSWRNPKKRTMIKVWLGFLFFLCMLKPPP